MINEDTASEAIKQFLLKSDYYYFNKIQQVFSEIKGDILELTTTIDDSKDKINEGFAMLYSFVQTATTVGDRFNLTLELNIISSRDWAFPDDCSYATEIKRTAQSALEFNGFQEIRKLRSQ